MFNAGNAFPLRVKIKSYHHMSHSFSGTLIPKSNTSKLRGFCLFFVFSSHSWRCCVNVTIFPSVDRYWRNLFQDLMLMEMDGWSELWKIHFVFFSFAYYIIMSKYENGFNCFISIVAVKAKPKTELMWRLLSAQHLLLTA